MGKSVIMNNERIGKSSDFWNNYEQDIRLAKELGKRLVSIPCLARGPVHVLALDVT